MQEGWTMTLNQDDDIEDWAVEGEGASTLTNLADRYRSQGAYGKAESLYLRALEIQEKGLGCDHPDTAITLNSLAGLYSDQSSYSKAEPLYLRALEIREKALGPDHLATATSLNNLALLYDTQGDYCKAKPLYLRSLKIVEKALGLDHPNTATSLNNLALLYNNQGDYSKAETLYLRSLKILEKALGPEHPDTATSLNNLALLYSKQGDYSKAEPFYLRAFTIREKALGPNHPNTATSLNNLAMLYKTQGAYSKAEPLFLRALEIREQALGPDHPATATSLNNLALLYDTQSVYSKAEPIYLRALKISEKALGPEHPNTAASLNGLAELYYKQGAFSKAEPLFLRSLKIREKALGPDYRYTAASLSNLALLYNTKGEYSKAEPLYLRSLKIQEKALGLDHPNTATSLNNLALLYNNHGDYSKAETLYLRSLKILEKALGPEHPDTATSLNNLALLYYTQGDYSKAEPLYLRSLKIRERVLGPDHPDTVTSLIELALHYKTQGGYSKSTPLLRQGLTNEITLIQREAPFLARKDREAFVESFGSAYEITFTEAGRDAESTNLALFARLNRQGLLQEIEQRQTLLASLPGPQQSLGEEFRALTRRLASASISPEKRQALRQRQEDLEKELYRLIPKLKPRLVQVEQVAAALPVAGALVEYQRFHLFDVSKPLKEKWGEARFLALILKPDGSVTAVDLGQAAVLESAIQEARSQTIQCFADSSSPWASISELLLSPLLPHLDESRLWFFSLDGELHRIPLHILPLPNKPDHLLVDAVSLRLVSSGRDLLSELFTSERSTSPGTALVVADPAFDLKPGTASPQDPDSINQQLRSRDMAIFHSWEPLPGTAKEGRKVAELLAAQLLTGCDATTLAVQKANRPRVLHIATHGFFLPDQTEQLQTQPWLSPDRSHLMASFIGEDPMLRSGLVLAGANHRAADPDEDDGLLTALEAVHLDLQGTELVTLSACDSGSGDIRTGEGVYGLQRAFIVAGAGSLLLSLWPVPDDATCAFMLHFYTHLKEGFGRYEALIAVQREFRKHENIVWRHPYYWGAWQLIGDGSPTEGL
jgi:CHAT domain-containing protein/Tfp pilus assembly protein PilF